MKTFVIWALLLNFASTAAEASKPLRLSALKAVKADGTKVMAKLSATLQEAGSGKVVADLQKDFGDCEKCARGVAIHGLLGIRLEGPELNMLTVRTKATPRSVDAGDCLRKGNQRLAGTSLECVVTIQKKAYSFNLRLD